MVITDSLEFFGEKFARFPMYRDFVALVVPLDKEGRTFIKKLENPKHDGLSAERLPDPQRRDHAKAVMKQLAKAIRDTIKSYTLAQFANEVSADELRRYFKSDLSVEPDAAKSAQDDPQTVRYRIEPSKPRPETRASARGKGDAGGVKPGPTPGPGPGPGPGSDPGTRPGGTGAGGSARPILLSDVRNRMLSNTNPKSRTILFTPSESGKATIVLEATGTQ